MALAPEDPRHGTLNGYTNLGCRCGPCRAAQVASQRRSRARRRAAAGGQHPAGKPESYTTYQNYSCRCAGCRAAWAAAQRPRSAAVRVLVERHRKEYDHLLLLARRGELDEEAS